MSNINDGGPAFPTTQANFDNMEPAGDGMTIRDYFAAKAMQGILAGDHPVTHEAFPLEKVADVAYQMADAMLRARKGGAS